MQLPYGIRQLGLGFRIAWKNITSPKTRARVVISIGGVIFSMFLLGIMLFLVESAKVTLVENITSDIEEYDYSVRAVSNIERTSPPFLNSTSLNAWLEQDDDIREYHFRYQDYHTLGGVPSRSAYLSIVNYSQDYLSNFSRYYGYSNGNYYDVALLDSSFDGNPANFLGNRTKPTCLLSTYSANTLQVVTGDEITLIIEFVLPNGRIIQNLSCSVGAIYNTAEGRDPVTYGVILDQHDLSRWIQTGYCENLTSIATSFPLYNQGQIWLNNLDNYYNINDFDTSEKLVLEKAGEIQSQIGIEWEIYPAKLPTIEQANMITTIASVILLAVSFLSFIISGTLIYGIVNTSLQEKIREYAIIRSVGARSQVPIAIAFAEALLLFSLGIIIGFVMSYFAASFIIRTLLGGMISNLGIEYVNMSVSSTTFLLPIGFGILFSLLTGALPAVKVAKKPLIESLHPYRAPQVTIKDQHTKQKLALGGTVLAFYGATIFLYLPFIVLTLNLLALVGFLVVLLLSIFVGFTFVVLGFRPVFLKFSLKIFNRTHRIKEIIALNLQKYKNRNQITSIQIAFCFSFIVFVGSLFSIANSMLSTQTLYYNGADLSLEYVGYSSPIFIMDDYYTIDPDLFPIESNFKDPISHPMLNKNSPSPSHIQSKFFNNEEYFTKDDYLDFYSFEAIERVSGLIHYNEIKAEDSVQLSDYASFGQSINLYGIDANYINTVYRDYIKFIEIIALDQGNKFIKNPANLNIEEIFSKLSEKNYCLIPKSISEAKNLHAGDPVKLSLSSELNNIQGDFIVLGVLETLPGFGFEFSQLELLAVDDAVILAENTLQDFAQLNSPLQYTTVFLKLNEEIEYEEGGIMTGMLSPPELANFKSFVQSTPYELHETYIESNQFQQASQVGSIIMEAMGWVAIFMAVLGLLTSTSSAYLERKRDTSILRVLGLYGKEVNKIFFQETLMFLMGAGLSGSMAGFLIAYFASLELNLFFNLPVSIAIPWGTLIRTFLIAIIMLRIGLGILFRLSHKTKPLGENLREE